VNDELDLLMRYCDSEVESAERAHVALTLLRDVEQRRCLDAWRTVGNALRLAARVPTAQADSIEECVMSRIASIETPSAERERGGRYRSAARLTLAAGFLLAVGLGADRHVGSTVYQDAKVAGTARLPGAPASPVGGPRIAGALGEGRAPLAIERVDLGSRSGAIFLVPVGDTETPVVWLNDDEQGGRIRNL
jgi:hypothetical protein